MTVKRYDTLLRAVTKMQTINYPMLDELLELIGESCIKIKPEHCHFIDEQIISAKGR